MSGLPLVLLFTAMTFIAWGAYGPTLHHGSSALSHDSLRAFVGVGLAYFLVAIVIPLSILRTKSEAGRWTLGGTLYSLVAGAVGALGALGIILALGYGGEAVFVMPVVFGFAPVVNTLVSALISGTYSQFRPIFLAAIATVALGAVGVLTFRNPVATAESSKATSQVTQDGAQVDGTGAEGNQSAKPSSDSAEKNAQDDSSKASAQEKLAAGLKKAKNMLGVVLSIIMAAVCWGSYGPMLHLGLGKLGGSRLLPFTCVGVSYFLIAVLAPLILIYGRTEDLGHWTAVGMLWSFLAGVAGAVGALGVILAFNAGGKPHYVMPLVFGFAPVINTFISLSEKGTWHLVQPLFWVSLIVVIAGAVTVLITAPKVAPKPAH